MLSSSHNPSHHLGYSQTYLQCLNLLTKKKMYLIVSCDIAADQSLLTLSHIKTHVPSTASTTNLLPKPMDSKQLTLMPILDGSVFVNSQVVNDPVLLSVLTDLHDRNYQFPTQEVQRWYFDTVKGLSRTPRRYS